MAAGWAGAAAGLLLHAIVSAHRPRRRGERGVAIVIIALFVAALLAWGELRAWASAWGP